MSEENEAVDTSCCASCGIAEIDDIKLKDCDGCDLVRYCSDACQRDHISRHLLACRKRAAELRDEILFKQPEESHLGDCPICLIPLPLDMSKFFSYQCCSKIICNGCVVANHKREVEARREQSCPFCREPSLITEEEADKLLKKRIEANDPVAICKWGVEQYNKGDYHKAFECYAKAAELGDVDARDKLACMYGFGEGVEKDKEKYIHHLEEAAIGGHPEARYALGFNEAEKGNLERAVKHWIIGATQGDDQSIKELLNVFKEGYLEKMFLLLLSVHTRQL